jgi:hypothetical protein
LNIAVIIPFRGDRTLLDWTLDGYAKQNLGGHRLEVFVGEDGGTPGGQPAAPEITSRGGIPVSVQPLPRVGAAAARNLLVRGVPEDTELIIFGNADARPDADMVHVHAEAMAPLPARSLVLGAAPWERPAAPTVFDALLEGSPMVFFYDRLKAHTWYDYRQAWTLNLSVRLADFRASGGFHDELRPVYYEDLAFAHRLMGAQYKGVWYEPAARVVHRHPTTLEQYLDREELLGLMAPVLARVCPEAFENLLGTRDVAALAAEYRAWVAMDAGSHRWVYSRMAEWAEQPESALGAGEARQRMLMTIYQMHIPLKRLAFRLGFLRGIELADDSRWAERRPSGLWRAVVTT